MKYRTTFRHLRIYIAFLTAISSGMAVMGILVQSALPAMAAIAVFAYLCAVRFIRSITFKDDRFEFNGIVRHWSVDWQDIKGLKRIEDYGWPIDRMFGNSTYEIQTVHGRRIVSFFFFPGDCVRELKKRIGPNKRLHRIADKSGSR